MRKSTIISILIAHFDYRMSELVHMTRKELYELYKDLCKLERVYGNLTTNI